MKADRTKYITRIRDAHTGEVLALAEMTQARARALVKAYQAAGLFVEAVAI